MSLTSILNYGNKDFKGLRDLLKNLFPSPRFRSDESIKAEPRTTNYMLIGTAFDYLLRFNLEKKYKRKVYGRNWVSENALKYFKGDSVWSSDSDEDYGSDYDTVMKWFEEKKARNKKVIRKFNECKKTYKAFIDGKLKNKDKLIESSLFLARLDNVYRAGPVMIEYVNFLQEDRADIEDLKQLTQVSDLNLFKPKRKVI